MSTVGEIMSTVGVFSTPGEYHDKCGGRSLGKQLNLYGNSGVLNISWCTHDIPSVYSWYLPVDSGYPPVYSMISPVYCTDIMKGESGPEIQENKLLSGGSKVLYILGYKDKILD